MLRKLLSALSLLLLIAGSAAAQDDPQTFRTFQFGSSRVSSAWAANNDSLAAMFRRKGISYPSANIYIRAFKSQNEMEVWGRNDDTSSFTLIKSYRVCALSGALGPKRYEGDRQVPEGLYFIDDFNPRSDFHLSMLVSYPNYSDLLLGNKDKPGGNIYIHGGCVTIGCLPMTDPVIQEIYVLCMNAKIAGQNYIPIHIYPTRFDRRGLNFLGREYADDTTKQRFWVNLKRGYDYFERTHKTQPVMYTPDGAYVF